MFEEEISILEEIFEGKISEEILKFAIETWISVRNNAAFKEFCAGARIALPGLKLYVEYDVDIEIVAKALRQNTKVEDICFYPNFKMNDYKAKKLAEALKINKVLKTLTINGYAFTDVGVTAISEALQTNNTLTALHFKENRRVFDEGALAISKALQTNNTLITLDLSGTQVSDQGVKAIMNALQTNSSLMCLFLPNNFKVSYRLKLQIDEMMKKRRDVKSKSRMKNILGTAQKPIDSFVPKILYDRWVADG